MARHKSKKAGKGSAGQNRKSSEQFLEKYGQRSDVISLDSGLMYRVVDALDEGPCPTEWDAVTIHQRILLADGTVIADSYREGQTDTFPVSEAIPGLKEGLQLMPVGSRYEFVLPPELAWGRKGNRSKIGPNAVLQMDIRLVAVE